MNRAIIGMASSSALLGLAGAALEYAHGDTTSALRAAVIVPVMVGLAYLHYRRQKRI